VDQTQIVLAIVGAIAVAAIIYFLFIRKAPTPEVEAPPQPKKLPEKEKPKAAEPAKAAPAKEKEKPAAKPEKPAAPAATKEKEAEVKAEKAAARAEKAPEAKVEPEPAARAEKAPEAKVAPAPTPVKAERPVASTRKRDVAGLRKGLAKAREKEGFFGRLRALFTGKKEIDPQIVEQIEEVLLTSDVGVKTTQLLLDAIKEKLEKKELADTDKVWQALREHAASILSIGGGGIALTAKPTVVMVVGVNGVGKTTTIGKLATKMKGEGKKVVLAAGDTFRAAAVEQLKIWGKRIDVEVVAGKDGANPGAVIFDAIQRAKEIGADVVFADTAGRLHTKTNLMEELTKVAKTMTKALEGAPHETLLVLDATNGQNAMQQAAMFKESLPLSGIVLTKLDGTAKGGVILGICAEHDLPVRYIGMGERAEDLRDFVPEEFVEAMLDQGDAGDAAA
jgi:fused signal recognition particle receptor